LVFPRLVFPRLVFPRLFCLLETLFVFVAFELCVL